MERPIRPTLRGLSVSIIATSAFFLGVLWGPRSLNAVVVPAIVFLLAGYYQLATASIPTIERKLSDPIIPASKSEIEVQVDSAVPCLVDERIPSSFGDEPLIQELGISGTFSYQIHPSKRGVYYLGPAFCKQLDLFGLFYRIVKADEPKQDPFVVYPEIFHITEFDMINPLESRSAIGIETFSNIREYTPADSMRDIHWRTSARYPPQEFMVVDFSNLSEPTTVGISGSAADGMGDQLASAVGSVGYAFLQAGISISVVLQDRQFVCHPGEERTLLWELAHADGGSLPENMNTDVHIEAQNSVTIRVNNNMTSFDTVANFETPQTVV